MRSYFYECISGLREAVDSEWHEIVLSLLCDYVYRTSLWTGDPVLLEPYRKGVLYPSSARQIVQLFHKRELFVRCGGASQFLMKICQEFGYDAACFDYGKCVGKHMMTVVVVPRGDELTAVLYDATFNSTMGDFFLVFDKILFGGLDDIAIEKGVYTPPTLHFSDKSDAVEFAAGKSVVELESGGARIWGVCAPRHFLDYWTSHGPEIRLELSGLLGKPADECHTLESMLLVVQWPTFKDRLLAERLGDLRGRVLDRVKSG